MTTEREIMRLTDAIERVMDRYLEVWDEPPEDIWAEFEANRLAAELDRLVGCLIEARPDTVRGVLLKRGAARREPTGNRHSRWHRRVLMSALADLERFRPGISLDDQEHGAIS